MALDLIVAWSNPPASREEADQILTDELPHIADLIQQADGVPFADARLVSLDDAHKLTTANANVPATDTPWQPSEQKPFYAATLDEAASGATDLYMVTVDEGWRFIVLCGGMYKWAADWLVTALQGKPLPAEVNRG